MNYVDGALLNLAEWFCHRFQRLTGRTNVWLALQLMNLSIVVYFIWAVAVFWHAGLTLQIVLGIFCGILLYVLTQTIFKVPIEAYEQSAYQRVAKGLRNPRRLRDAPLRISFLTLTLALLLAWPVMLIYPEQARLFVAPALIGLTTFLSALMTLVLYLLSCDPLPPCTGTLWVWLGRPARVTQST